MGGKDSTRAAPQGAASARERGLAAERLAADWMAAQGLAVIDRNVRFRGGEIDLICRDHGTLVFVEVRQRGASRFGGAAESITPAKIRRIVLAARLYLAAHPALASLPARFDCVLLDTATVPEVRWLRNAFSAD